MENTNENSNGFFITKRQASAFTTITLLLLVGALIVGYFWGQKSAIKEFTNKVMEDSFADQVSHSFYSLTGGSSEKNDEGADLQSNSELQKIEQDGENEPNAQAQSEDQRVKPIKTFYAELVGFGSMKAANQFVNKMQKKGYNILIRQRISKTSRGKKVSWYQAVTQNFDDMSKLKDLIERIKSSEKLYGVKIVAV
jgi:hypothetical protein